VIPNTTNGVRFRTMGDRELPRVEELGLAEAGPHVNGQNLATKPMVNTLAVS